MAKKKTESKAKPKVAKKPFKPVSIKLTKQQQIVLGSFLFFLGIALFISFASYLFSWKADQSLIEELGDDKLLYSKRTSQS